MASPAEVGPHVQADGEEVARQQPRQQRDHEGDIILVSVVEYSLAAKPVVLTIARSPPACSPAPISRQTDDLPRVPLT